MHISGSCHCGAIRFEAEADPAQVCVCHCTDCQALSGSAFRTVAFAPEHSFKLLSGRPTVYVKTADSGNRREQTFCPVCGSPIYSRAAGAPFAAEAPPPGRPVRMLGIRVGTLAERGRLTPKLQYYCRSAQPWAMEIAGAARLPGGLGTEP
ncbi:MAG: GFA family protein [Rhodospirillales bacterium]